MSTEPPGLPAIILARGGSKGIPNKNIKSFCGKPLITWSIEHALNSNSCAGVWVSTDSTEIAEISENSGAIVLNRPAELSGDTNTSESGWLHAVGLLESAGISCENIVALQATSPLRKDSDFDQLATLHRESGADSLFSGSVLDDITLWELSKQKGLIAVNHDPSMRLARQDMPVPIVENGSMYLMNVRLLKETGSRFHGKIAHSPNSPWQMHEIDSLEDFELCEILMKTYVSTG